MATRFFHNLEPSAFRPGEYVGYARGGEVFRIWRARGGWTLSSNPDNAFIDPADFVRKTLPTLKACSEHLSALSLAWIKRARARGEL